MQSMMVDLGFSAQVRFWTDSNAAKAKASSRGLGKTRHVELNYLWLQEVTKSGRVKMRRVPGEQNLTKGKPWHEIDALIRGVGGFMKMSQDNKENDEKTEEVAGEMKPHWLRTSCRVQQCTDNLVRGVHRVCQQTAATAAAARTAAGHDRVREL